MQFNFGSPSKRFWRLVREKDERELTAQELEFLDSHRNQSLEDSSLEIAELRAMEFLRSEQVDPVVRPTFNEGVLREYRLQRMESGAARWKPRPRLRTRATPPSPEKPATPRPRRASCASTWPH